MPAVVFCLKNHKKVMITPKFQVGESFHIQFVWQLPDGDYLRAIFDANVLVVDEYIQRYKIKLDSWLAGRQEDPNGNLRPKEEISQKYWQLVDAVTGNVIDVAFEADDSRPLHLRLVTLTGEHTFFTRHLEEE